MTDQLAVGSLLGAVLSFALQFLKRWYTFTPEAVRGFVILASIAYSVIVALIGGTFNFWLFISNLGTFLLANQGFFALVLNNTQAGYKLAGYVNDR